MINDHILLIYIAHTYVTVLANDFLIAILLSLLIVFAAGVDSMDLIFD
jgi:hypothetical protein